MKLETFFEKFEMFADAPDAVAKMRELVLELAVSGAISERHAADQDDPAWREFCSRSEGRGRDSEMSFEPPFRLPNAWRWVSLDDLGTTRVRNDADDCTRVSFVPMALISSAYGIRPASEERTWSEVKTGFTHFADGDVVVAKITPCFENGKSGVMRGLLNGLGTGTTELHVFRRNTDIILPEFVLIFVKSRGFIARGEPRMTGSAGQKRLPRDYFAKSPFPLPPPAEQKRIVAKVDELMALCDRLEAQQEEREKRHAAVSRAALARFSEAPTPSNLNLLFHKSYTISPADLRKTILTLAVQGKLVPQDPGDEAADNLVARLEQERPYLAKEQGVRLPKSVPPLSVRKSPHSIPASWRWSRTGHLALVIDYGTSQKAGRDASKVPVYRMGNIVGGRLVNENLKYVDSHIDDLPGLYLKTGDILFNRTNSYELVGKVGIFAGRDDSATFASYLIRIRLPSTYLCSTFFSIAMNAPYFRQTQIEPEVVQQCGQANFNGTKLASTVVPIPPLAEQRRIVARVDHLMATVDGLEAQLKASLCFGRRILDVLGSEVGTDLYPTRSGQRPQASA